MKVKREIEVEVCDSCGIDRPWGSVGKCYVCGKQTCTGCESIFNGTITRWKSTTKSSTDRNVLRVKYNICACSKCSQNLVEKLINMGFLESSDESQNFAVMDAL